MSARVKKGVRSAGGRRFLGKARSTWLYTQQDVQELYGVCPNTVRNWRREGLKSTKVNLRLFLGRDLNDFHKRRREEAKRPCGPDEIYCLCCKQKHSLLEVQFSVEDKGRFRTRLRVTCPVTGGTTTTYVSDTDLVSLTQRLKRSSSPAATD